jgi:two-component system phosphate regulon sensor histidine kinase PhoR
MRFSRQEIGLLCGVLVLALLLGWISDQLGWAFFIAALVWITLQQRERIRLQQWALRPISRPSNQLDPWQDLSLRLFRTIQRARERHRRTLNQFKALRSITDSLPDAAIIVDGAGNIENLNIAAQKMLRLKPQDQGNHLSSLVREPGFASLIKGQIEDHLIEFGSPFAEDIRLEARRIDMANDRCMILVRDVTELNRLLSMRQDFIANVSHELRTPLTVIVGYIETLMNEELDRETTHELVAKLLSPTTRMRALVDDLLLLTRLESSPNPAEDEVAPVDMGRIINAISADARMLSGGRHDIEVDQRSQAQVLGIDSELHSACLNLVTNAVRYSPDGGTIRISWQEVPGGARFAVEDQGMGIPREHLPRITERFYRVDLAQSRVRGGTGLGLAIVKHVLKRHNTNLQVDSELASGSTFYCVFPNSQLTRCSAKQEII